MKIVVTGAAGLLGRYTCKRLLARGDEVVAIDNRSRFRMFDDAKAQPWPAELAHERCLKVDESFYSQNALDLIREVRPDAIVHAAAQTSHPRSIDVPYLDFEVNALGTLKLLELLRDEDRWHGVARPRLVFISSAKVYGENVAPCTDGGTTRLHEGAMRFATVGLPSGIFDREGFRDADPMSAEGVGVSERCPLGDQTMLTPFGISKAAADMYVQVYAKLYGIDAVILRPGCFTAPGSLAVERQNWLPPLALAMVRGASYPVYGWGGKQVRDLLHADDLARAVLACVDAMPTFHYWQGDVFNVGGGPGNDVSLLESVELIHEITGRRGSLEHHPKRQGDWPWFVTSNQKITGALGWKPKIGVRQLFEEICTEAMARE